MSINVICPNCGKSYDVIDSRAGQTGKCECGSAIQIPSSANVENQSSNQIPDLQAVAEQPAATNSSSRPLMLKLACIVGILWCTFWITRTVKDIMVEPSITLPNGIQINQIPLYIQIITWNIFLSILYYLTLNRFNWAKITLLVLLSINAFFTLCVALSPFFRQFGNTLAWIDTIVVIFCIVGLSSKSTWEFFRR